MLTSSSQGPRRGSGAELPAARCSLPGLSPGPVSAQPGAMVSESAAGGQQAMKHAGGLLKPGQRGGVALPYSLSTGVLDGGWPGHHQAAAHIRPLARQGGEGLGAGRQGSLGAPLGVSAVGYNQVGAAAVACLRLAQDAGGVSLPALWPSGKDQLSGQQGSKGEGAGEVGLAPHPCHPVPLLAPHPTAMKQHGRQRQAEQQGQQQQGRQRQVPAAAPAVPQHDSQLSAPAESAAAREGQEIYCGLSQVVLPDPNASQPLGSSRPPTPTPQRQHSQAGPGEACSAPQSLPASHQPARSPQPMQPQPPHRPAPQAPREGLPGAPGPGAGLGAAAAPPKQFMRGAPAVRRRLQAGSMFNTGDAEVKTALADALDAIQDASVQASLKLQAQLPRAAPEEVLAHAIQVSLQQKQTYMHSMQALRMDVVKREQRQRTRY
ncbi:hypothetical protein QJQ45_023551 [Haematococcus lacustris]|nr:hypothetical protein QJQ45_023551 [Haematococcus lacustris]